MPDTSLQCPHCETWFTFPKGIKQSCPFCNIELVEASKTNRPKKISLRRPDTRKSHAKKPDAVRQMDDAVAAFALKEKMRRAQIRTHFRWMKELFGHQINVSCQCCGEQKRLGEFRVPLDKENKIVDRLYTPTTEERMRAEGTGEENPKEFSLPAPEAEELYKVYGRFIENEIPICGTCFYSYTKGQIPLSANERKIRQRAAWSRALSKWYHDRRAPVPDPPICPVCNELRSPHYNAWVTFQRKRAVCRRCVNRHPGIE